LVQVVQVTHSLLQEIKVVLVEFQLFQQYHPLVEVEEGHKMLLLVVLVVMVVLVVVELLMVLGLLEEQEIHLL
tara:strand:- start:389 stop:607 length:219 start_codon:yes stop_codon:yes gene_type:complete